MRLHYFKLGTQLYCAPTVDSREVWQHTMHHIGLEGRVFVLSACQFSTQADYPEGHAKSASDKEGPETICIAGGSVIVSPSGETLAGPLRGREGLLTAEIDLDDCIRGGLDLGMCDSPPRRLILMYLA